MTGRFALPGDDTFAELAQPWALAMPISPAAVLEVADVDDIVAAVRFAGEHGIGVTVQPIGHGASASLDDTLLLRTGLLDSIEIDVDRRVATVGAGVSVVDFQTALTGTGLTGLPGSNPIINVVAFALGGGYSLVGNAFGNPAATIRSADVVTADGEVLHLDDASHPDLLWALRGGGGGFAIVTALEIDLVESALSGGRLEFKVADAAKIIGPFLDFLKAAGPETTAIWNRTNLPNLPQLPEHLRGARRLFVDVIHAGELAELEPLLAPLLAAAPVERSTVSVRQPGEVSAICEEPTVPSAGLGRSAFISDVSEAFILELDEVLNRTPSVATIHFRNVGGALAEAGAHDGAYAPTSATGLLTTAGIAPNPEVRAVVATGLEGVITGLDEWLLPATPLTFLDPDEPVERAFDAETLTRLRAIKAEVDPRDTLRSNRPLG